MVATAAAPSSVDALFNEHQEWAIAFSRVVTRGRARRLDAGQCEQAALLGLWKAAQRFDAARGVPFRSYAAFFMRCSIKDEFRGAAFFGGRNSGPEPLALFGDDPGGSIGATLECTRRAPSADENAIGDLADALPTGRHWAVIILRYARELTIAETAECLGEYPVAVWNLERAALRRLRELCA